MKVLYVSAVLAEDTPALRELADLDPVFDIQVAAGAAAALVQVRTQNEYRALFLSPQLPPNEALALIATLRRDRAPVAVVAIITEDQRQFFAAAITAGADDVLVMRDTGFAIPEETLRRVRHSRHLDRPSGQPPLRVLFVGQDDLAWDLLIDMPFVVAERAGATVDGSCPTTLPVTGVTADAIIIDEQPGDGHALQVVKWLKAHAPNIPLVVLTSPTGGDIGGAALDMGADDVVSKAGTYRRRLIATLHRHYLRKITSASSASSSELTQPPAFLAGPVEPFEPVAPLEPVEPVEPDAPVEPDEPDEPDEAFLAAEARIRELTAEVQSLSEALAAKGQTYDELVEAQGFERAMRDRDRDELVRLRQGLTEERERRIVLEGTLRHTEDRAASELAALDATHTARTRHLEEQLAVAADRLHEVANQTQVLHTRLQNELAAQTAERGRLIQNVLFGYATVTVDGALTQCNATFARMFGFDDAADAVAGSGPVFAGLADHAHVMAQLQAGIGIDRVESVLRRSDGRTLHVLTSAALLPAQDNTPALVERLFIDLDGQTHLEEQLRLARRLESAGRLAAEVSDEIEPVLSSLNDPSQPAEARTRAVTLVRQLLSYSRRLAKPAGHLSLYDAILRAEPHLRHLAGDGITLELRLEDVGTISASEDDVEQLLAALVFAAAASLPYGGTVVLDTRSVRSGFDQHTELAVGASGYGVHTASLSSTLARLVTRCGGTVRVADEPARATTLHVHLPC